MGRENGTAGKRARLIDERGCGGGVWGCQGVPRLPLGVPFGLFRAAVSAVGFPSPRPSQEESHETRVRCQCVRCLLGRRICGRVDREKPQLVLGDLPGQAAFRVAGTCQG